MRLELRCPQNVQGIQVDPEPDWNFESLLSEINVLEKKMGVSSHVPVPFAKTKLRNLPNGKTVGRSRSTFVMHISDDDTDDEVDQSYDRSLVATRRFACDDIYLSDSDESEDDDETADDAQLLLMDKVGSVESGLFELKHEHELVVKEDIRNRISTLEMDLMNKIKKSASALVQVDKYGEARREMDRKHDTQYQRNIAEALDNHLTAVQRDHELKSQIEERKIRKDAAFEEAKRKEKSLQEEKLRQEKAKMEAEMQAKIRYEEAKRAALEAERRTAKEVAEREAAERVATERSKQTAAENQKNASVRDSNATSRQSTGNIIKATPSALELEKGRLQKFQELDEKNNTLKLNANKDFISQERHIGRLVRQIRGIKENISTKSRDLIKLLNDPQWPQSVSVASFAKKVVSHCESPDNAAFACGHVIVHVTSQIPYAMDILLAEFHRACIYTIPKHLAFSESAFQSRDAYRKAIGYRENDGKIEDISEYLKRLESYMKLYGALVQTEVPGVQNTHGLEAGWAWLARFLNGLPANRYTAVALNAFLQAAGYALHMKYKSQFRKILKIISEDFLGALKGRQNSELTMITVELQSFIDDKKFLEAPEGRALQSNLLSSVTVPELEYHQSHQQSYYQPSYNQSYQQSRYF